jgi:O-antigen ligase/polysaccharide polymerase Wzy-like membrane protein
MREHSFTSPLVASSAVSVLLLAALLIVLGVHLIPFALLLGATALLWLLFQHPLGGLGIFLAFMPVFPMAFMLGEFFGPPSVTLFSPCDRVAVVLATLILLGRNGIKLTSADWFLVACFGLAVIRLAFGGELIPLLSDFNLMFAYAAGRVAILTANQETLWARRAVWILAILSVLGMAEVFVFGEGPRTLLYLSVSSSATRDGALDAPFHADGYSGLREAATMIGPLQFAPLCMAALIVWWVYCRKPWPAGMIAAGLICSVTRSAWLGTALAIPLLAIVMEQKRRFFLYAALVVALFVASVPLLGFGDYLLLAKSGQDSSTTGHQESLLKGWEYIWDHPFGLGPGNAGSYASKNNSNEVSFESTYLTFAAEYGIPATFCFLGFLLSALRIAWRERTQLGYMAVGILVGFGAVMIFAPLHLDFSLATWIWFPVGLAVRSSVKVDVSEKAVGGLAYA